MHKKSVRINTSVLNRHPISLAALLALSAGAWAQSSASGPPALPAATLEFVQGSVAVRSAAGASRIAQRGTVVNNGETIETQSGRAQMRMIDGAFISLQNDTTLRLDNYRVASATESESGFMSLVRGGLRTVTGLIGRSSKQNYRLQTATATVGIRGTGFSATSGEDGTRVRVAEGAIALCTQGGCLDLAAMQSGYAANSNTLPVRIAAAPTLQPTQAPSIIVAAAQTPAREIEVASIVERQQPPEVEPLPYEPPPGPPRIPLTNAAPNIGFAINTPTTFFNASAVVGATSMDGEGRLIAFTNSSTGLGYSAPLAAISDFGSDGIIAWGRWNGGNTTYGGEPTGSIQHLTYIVGNTGAAVPIVGTYTVFGSTAPVAINSAGGVSSIGASNSVTGNMQINFPGATGGSLTYNLYVPIAGQTFNVAGNANQLLGTGFVGTSSTIGSTGGGCTNGCTGALPNSDALQGGVVGSGNSRVGATYGFNSTIGIVTGAVVFRPATGN